LCIVDEEVTHDIAKMIKELLTAYKAEPEWILHHLVLDNCKMSDASFAIVLDGVMEQGKQLRSLAYSRNEIGPTSLEKLDRLLPNLRDLRVSRLTFLHGD